MRLTLEPPLGGKVALSLETRSPTRGILVNTDYTTVAHGEHQLLKIR